MKNTPKELIIYIVFLLVTLSNSAIQASPEPLTVSEDKLLINQKMLDLFKTTITPTTTGIEFNCQPSGYKITVPSDWFIGPKLEQFMSPDKEKSLTILPTMEHSDDYIDVAKKYFGVSNPGYYNNLSSNNDSEKHIWFLATYLENMRTRYTLTYVIPGTKHDYWLIFEGNYTDYESNRKLCDTIVKSFCVTQ